MAIYYVSPYGFDTNTGLTKHPTTAGGAGPWRTLKKALETGGLAAGDTVYVAPGDYGGTITCAYSGNADTDAGRIKIYGDPRNEQGFTSDGTTLIKPGMCNINETNRFSPPVTTQSLISLSYRNYLTFKNLNFCRWRYSTTSYLILANANSTFIMFDSCCFSGTTYSHIHIFVSANAQLNWTINNCIMHNGGFKCIHLSPTPPTTAETDLAVTISNCLLIGCYGVAIGQNAGPYFAGGVTVNNCTIYANVCLYAYGNTITPATYKLVANNCILANATFYLGSTTVYAYGSGQIVTNNCILNGAILNATRGKNDIPMNGTDIALTGLYFEIGQSQLWGFQPKPFFTPLGLPGVGACNTNPGNLTTDLLGRPRPAGGGVKPVGVGTGAYETGTVTTGSTATTLVVAGTPWTVDAFIGKKVKLLTAPSSNPTLVGAVRWISSNTNNTLTVTPSWDYTANSTNFPLSGDTYEIYDPAKDIAVGCYELHNTGELTTSVSADGTQASIKLTGPADHEFLIPVKKGKTYVFNIKARFESAYTFSTGAKPAATILANAKLGVAADIANTMTGAANTWELLQFTPITPTANGKLIMRLTNKSDTPTASCYFDSFSY